MSNNPARNVLSPIIHASQSQYTYHNRPNLERFINERDRNHDRRGFQEVLAVQYRFPACDPSSVPRSFRTFDPHESMTSSMAVSVEDRSDSEDTSQSYTHSSSSVQSHTSTSGNTAGRRPGRLACAYSFLACSFTSDSFVEWDAHCKSHFKGCLPKNINCPFDCDWKINGQDGNTAWTERNKHIIQHHRNDSVVTSSSRLDPGLIQHLWKSRVITDIQVQELRRNGRLSEDTQRYVTMADNRRDQKDRHRHRTPRTVVSV